MGKVKLVYSDEILGKQIYNRICIMYSIDIKLAL